MLAVASAALPAIRREASGSETRWIRAGVHTERPVWGLRKGVLVALWPGSVEDDGDGGPRGLIRIGVPLLEGGKRHGLINFIAVEPVVGGSRGYSELETSSLDGRPGRLFWTGKRDAPSNVHSPGTLTRVGSAESLTVTVYMERFSNGARPIVDLEISSRRPDEVQFTVRSAPDSVPMQYCVLTATMGNYARLRKLWLRERVATPSELWPDFRGEEFTPDAVFSAASLAVLKNGDRIVCASTDEEAPWSVPPDPQTPWWHYRGSFNLTQYWRKPRGTARSGLCVRVNARRTYWASHSLIPNGPAYENFELVEPFHEGQVFVFGATRKTPRQLGLTIPPNRRTGP